MRLSRDPHRLDSVSAKMQLRAEDLAFWTQNVWDWFNDSSNHLYLKATSKARWRVHWNSISPFPISSCEASHHRNLSTSPRFYQRWKQQRAYGATTPLTNDSRCHDRPQNRVHRTCRLALNPREIYRSKRRSLLLGIHTIPFDQISSTGRSTVRGYLARSIGSTGDLPES